MQADYSNSNFQIFVTVVTGVGLRQITLRSYIRWPPSSPIGYLVENRGRISYTRRVMANYLLKFSNIRYHGNRGRLSKVWLTALYWPKTPVGASIWGYQLYKLSYSRFCVENLKGSIRAKYNWHSWIDPPRKPYHRTKNYDSILYATEVMVNFLVKFPIFRYHGNRGRLSKVWLTPLNWARPKTP